MIGGITPHARTRQDARYLSDHLLKEQPTVELINSVAPDLRSVIDDMQLARDGSNADAAALHLYLSPSRDMSDDELRQAADIVLRHFGAEEHQAAIVYHDKERRGGDGRRHAHLVVGRVGPDGHVIPSGFEIIRMETAMRIVEFEMGEPPVLGEHYASSVRWLRKNGRDDVADRLESAFGGNPDRPRSAASPSKRQSLERQGVDLSDARESVKAAWSAADGAAAFHAAMAEKGLTVTPGDKAGVFIVRAGDIEVGALDRIIGEKRKAVAERMQKEEEKNDVASPAKAPEEIAVADRRDDPHTHEQSGADRHADAEFSRSSPGPADDGAAGRSGGPDSAVAGHAGQYPRPSQLPGGPYRAPPSTGRIAQQKKVRVAAAAQLRRRDWTSTRERSKTALQKVSERLDRIEQEMSIRLAKARRIDPPSFMAQSLRDSVAKFDAELAKAQEAREAAWLDMLAAKKALPNKFWVRAPFEWFARWQRYDETIKALERAGELRDAARAAAKEKRRIALPALDADVRERRERRDAAVAAIEQQNKRDRLLVAAARQVLLDDPALARKGLKAVLEEAARRLEQQDAHRLALERRATFRVVPARVDEPSTTYGPR